MNYRRLSFVLALSLSTAPSAYAASAVMLQFGSFETKAEAEQRLTKVKADHAKLFADMPTSVREVKLPPDNLTVYRTQAGPVESRGVGQSLCSQFTGAGEECYVVETAIAVDAPKAKPTEEAVAAPSPAPTPAAATTETPATAAPVEAVEKKEEAPAPSVTAAKDGSPELQSALDKAVEAQKNAPAPHSISAPSAPSKPSFWSRLNPFGNDTAEKAAAPAAAVAAAAEPEKHAEATTAAEVKPAEETQPADEKPAAQETPPQEPAPSLKPAAPKLSALTPPPSPEPAATAPVAAVAAEPAPALKPTEPKLSALTAPAPALAPETPPAAVKAPEVAVAAEPVPEALAPMPGPAVEKAPLPSFSPPASLRGGIIPPEFLPPPPVLTDKDREFMKRNAAVAVAPAAPVAAPTVLKQPSVLATPSVLASPAVLAKAEPMAAPIRPAPAVVPPTAAIPAPLSPGDGLVEVEEAKRVPLTESKPIVGAPLHQLKPSAPTVSLLPSSTVGLKTLWAHIGPFNDPQIALAFWENYRLTHPDFPVVRVRVVSSVQNQSHDNTKVGLRVGPFGRSAFISTLCESIEDEDKIRCGLVKDSGVAGSAGDSMQGYLNGSRYKR